MKSASTLALLSMALLVSGVAVAGEASPPPPEIRLVRTVVATARAEGEPVSLTGHIRARTEESLAFRIDGRVIARRVDVGQIVKPGDLVAELDPQPKQDALRAAQAVIAMENARLITETREALEQQTATAEVLQVINSSPGDLKPVFDAILEKAHTLCGASSGGLIEIDGDRHRAIAVHGDREFTEYWFGLGWTEFVTDAPARLRRGEIVHIEDYASLRSGRQQRLIELSGARSLLLVPLLKDEVLLGAITAFRPEVRPFSDKEIALMRNFAAQAAIAMENARLITETREALKQQTATAEVLQVINSSPGDLTPVFDAMPASPAGRALRGENVVHVPDILEDEPYRAGLPGMRGLAELGKARTLLWVTLRREGEVIGSFVIFRQEVKPFTEKQIAL